MYKNVLLIGGGLDSVAYLIMLHKSIDACLFIDYEQKPSNGEYKACKYFCDKYNIPFIVTTNSQIYKYNKKPCLLFTGNMDDNPYVEGRNLSLLLTAFEHGDNIIFGFCDPGYPPFPDATQEFIENTNKLIKAVFTNKSVNAPYISILRTDLLLFAYIKDQELFDKSVTCWCYDDDNGECGKCRHCKLKKAQKEEIIKKYESLNPSEWWNR